MAIKTGGASICRKMTQTKDFDWLRLENGERKT